MFILCPLFKSYGQLIGLGFPARFGFSYSAIQFYANYKLELVPVPIFLRSQRQVILR
jgi:hypothetical protein